VIAGRTFAPGATGTLGDVVVATQPVSATLSLWTELDEAGQPSGNMGDIQPRPGTRFPLLELRGGAEAPGATTAQAYSLWYKIRLPDIRAGWVQAAVPSTFETGADGHPSTIFFNFYPAILAPTSPS
jgi:hypothetical protein